MKTINIAINRARRGRAMNLMFAALIVSLLGISSAFAQNESVAVNAVKEIKTAPAQPMVKELRGIGLGMTIDDVKDKLGKPKLSDDQSLYYVFSGGESLQIGLDPNKKVKMLAMIYEGKKADAPEFQEVFGPDVSLIKETDGRIYKLMRYPEAGYWVAYGRLMVQDEPMTTVTIQAIN